MTTLDANVDATPNSPTPLFPSPLVPFVVALVFGSWVTTKSKLTVTYGRGLGIGGMK